MGTFVRSVACAALALCASCAALGREELPERPPPLATLREPLALREAPDDEAARRELPLGSFTGVHAADARRSLDALVGAPEGVEVARIAENAPALEAGLREGDLLLEARLLGSGGAPQGEPFVFRWPSDWRAFELAAPPGARARVVYERAGAELSGDLTLAPRLEPTARQEPPRLREEWRAGVVVRGATEVEARASGLPPGAGAVVVGLAVDSPWRAAGLRYEDRIVAVDGAPLADPAQLLQAIREAPEGGALRLALDRGGERLELTAPLTRRERELKRAGIPLLFSFRRDGERATTSALLGLFRLERTPAAWDLRLLYLLRFGGGDADRLEEVRQ